MVIKDVRVGVVGDTYKTKSEPKVGGSNVGPSTIKLGSDQQEWSTQEWDGDPFYVSEGSFL